jgi:hypothetical protein
LVRIAAALSWLVLPVTAAENPELLNEFRKTKPDVSQVHVIAETPLLVAVTGQQRWGTGELLGVFARRGEQIVQISILPNNEFTTAVRVERQTADSITLGLADPDSGALLDNLKIFFDPKSYFPKRIARFSPVHVHRIAVVAGVLTLSGSNDKEDFVARERNGAWRITTSPVTQAEAARPIESVAEVAPMPVSTFGEFEQARPLQAKQAAHGTVIEEKIGPYQKVGTKIWTGKIFDDSGESTGIGDIGYFDIATQDWVFLHLSEMADWSTSALLVEPEAVWVGLVRHDDGAGASGGLLRYDQATHKVTTIPLADQIDRIVRVGKRLYCGTSGGFAIVDGSQVRRFEFTPQLDGSYSITPGP